MRRTRASRQVAEETPGAANRGKLLAIRPSRRRVDHDLSRSGSRHICQCQAYFNISPLSSVTREPRSKHKNCKREVKESLLSLVTSIRNTNNNIMDVFLMIRRKNTTIFTDAKENTTVFELKKIIEGILKVPPVNQRLFNKENVVMNDSKLLCDYGLTSATAKVQCPALVGLAIRQAGGQFEHLEMTPFSIPSDLPDAMKLPETNGQESSP